MTDRNITTAKVYELINNVRIEIKQDILNVGNNMAQNQARLENKFDELEAGRLTRAEAKIRDLEVNIVRQNKKTEVNQAVLSTKVLILWTMAILMITTIVQVSISRILK